MKKRITICLVLGILLIPLAFRAAFPNLYIRIWTNHPIAGIFLVVALDIFWMWVALFGTMFFSRVIRRVRNR